LSAATDGTSGVTDKTRATSQAKRIFIRRQSSQQGADTSLRLGDHTLRKPHYQTGRPKRQPLATPQQFATINRDNIAGGRGINRVRDALSALNFRAMIQVPPIG
jgi:hypothetical protein